MDNMFCGCKSLRKLDLSHFNIENVGSKEDMFDGCSFIWDFDENEVILT